MGALFLGVNLLKWLELSSVYGICVVGSVDIVGADAIKWL